MIEIGLAKPYDNLNSTKGKCQTRHPHVKWYARPCSVVRVVVLSATWPPQDNNLTTLSTIPPSSGPRCPRQYHRHIDRKEGQPMLEKTGSPRSYSTVQYSTATNQCWRDIYHIKHDTKRKGKSKAKSTMRARQNALANPHLNHANNT